MYPRASLPLAPLLPATTSDDGVYSAIPSVLDLKYTRTTISGRYAIALALEHIGLQAGDSVLLPAYHCEAMVAPIKWLNATPVYYAIHPDTSIHIDDLRQKINASVKAIIVTHYFGFMQDFSAIRSLCDQHNIKLIEDCAHAFFGAHNDKVGHYIAASSMKFLPLYEGGILASNTIDLSSIKLTPPSIAYQCKSAFNIVEKSISYNRLGKIGRLLGAGIAFKNSVWTALKKLKNTPNALASGPSSSSGGYGLDGEWVHKTASWLSQRITQATDMHRVAHQRRENYQKLHNSLAHLPNSRPLFDTLPPQCVPWVYPLYVDKPEQVFGPLKTQGVPIWRFGEFLAPEVTEQVCPVSLEYIRHIFQFPCHQSLTNQEIAWMVKQITKTLTELK